MIFAPINIYISVAQKLIILQSVLSESEVVKNKPLICFSEFNS